jgi:hypothetical protein
MSNETIKYLEDIFGDLQLSQTDKDYLCQYCKELEEKIEISRTKNIEIENSEEIFKKTVVNLNKLFEYVIGTQNDD